MLFLLFIVLLILLRIGELLLARRNERWLLRHEAIESGQGHYPLIILLHVLFFVSLIAEYRIVKPVSYSPILLLLFFVLLALKIWSVLSLGRFWTTKIYHIPGRPLIKKGLYQYVKHPNYILVIAEIAVIPLIFHLYYTAIMFSILNGIMLTVRIKEENKALGI